MKKIWTLTIALVVAAAFLATPASRRPRECKLGMAPEEQPQCRADGICREGEDCHQRRARTGGEQRRRPGYKGPELLKVVRDGLVPVSDMLISGVAGDEKVFQIVTLPFLVRTSRN